MALNKYSFYGTSVSRVDASLQVCQTDSPQIAETSVKKLLVHNTPLIVASDQDVTTITEDSPGLAILEYTRFEKNRGSTIRFNFATPNTVVVLVGTANNWINTLGMNGVNNCEYTFTVQTMGESWTLDGSSTPTDRLYTFGNTIPANAQLATVKIRMYTGPFGYLSVGFYF